MKHIENFSEKFWDAMEYFCEISQAVMGVLVFVCILVEVVAWLFMGRINTLLGLLVAGVFLLLGWALASGMVKEYRELKNARGGNE